jgi:hypothetical protein
MKQVFVGVVLVLALTTNAQTQSPQAGIRVNYTDSATHGKKIAIFLNDKFVGSSINKIIKVDLIENFSVIKEPYVQDSTHYAGQVYITAKANQNLKLVTFNDLKQRYTNLANKPAVFMLDGDVVNENYDKCFVDENNLLEITVDRVVNTKENINVTLVKLFTKTEENIKRSQNIMIRGADDLALNR